jgi:tetratricopeptide (TPR) repeat protein
MMETIVAGPAEIAEPSASRAAAVPISQETVREQLKRVLNSKAFARSPRISRFLDFVVEQTLDGQESKLKEYLLGVEVFGRLDSFDPRIDSIVRVEARRLRYKLDKYYESEGPTDPIYIQFRKGCYVPSFCEKRPGEELGTGELAEVPNTRAIEDPHVFAHYARGRACVGRWSADGIAEAVSCFTRALEDDENCPSANAGLASAWMFSSMLGLMPSRDVVPKAKISATRALAVLPASPEALSILGLSLALYDWDWTEAEPKLRKAIHSNPCDTAARLCYGLYLTLAGRAEQGVREARKGQQAAATSLTAHLTVGFAYHAGQRYEEALTQYRLAQDLDSSFYGSYLAMGLLFTDQSMFEQASNMLNRAAQSSPRNPAVMAAMAYNHAAAGRDGACRQLAGELAALAQKQYVSPLAQAMAYSAGGDVDAAFRKLDDAVQERSTWLPVIRFLPAFQLLRQDPRFTGLLSRMNLA